AVRPRAHKRRPESPERRPPAAPMITFGRHLSPRLCARLAGALRGADTKSAERTHLGPFRGRHGTVTGTARRVSEDPPGSTTPSGPCAGRIRPAPARRDTKCRLCRKKGGVRLAYQEGRLLLTPLLHPPFPFSLKAVKTVQRTRNTTVGRF